MTTITSNCANYTANPGGTAQLTYDIVGNPPPIVQSIKYRITGGPDPDDSSRFNYLYDIIYGVSTVIMTVIYRYVDNVFVDSSNQAFYDGFTASVNGTTVTINVNSNVLTAKSSPGSPTGTFLSAGVSIPAAVGDSYLIQLVNCNGSGSANNPIAAQVVLNRQNNVGVGVGGAGGGFSGITGGCSGCACFTNNSCGNVRVPIVTIQGQTTFDGEYLADMLFTICDEFQYYKCKPLRSCCKVNFIKSELVLQTQFRTCGVKLEEVVKGKGSLRDKLLAIYDQFSSILGPSFNGFYENFILYAMAKYVLARILYGDFNLDYLLSSFNRQFLEDLGNSRFCAFLVLFEDCNSSVFGFNKFFKSGKKNYSESSVVVKRVRKDCGCK